MRTIIVAGLAALAMAEAAPALAQQGGVHVRSIRVLATDPEAVATFYEKAFGMSETRRPANTATFKEIIINSGSTPDLAKKATSTPIVIATRPKDAPAGAMAALILEVSYMDKAIEAVKAAGGTLMRPAAKSGEGLSFAFVKDTDGNQIELVLSAR
jgi:predicted enzyme related to lactoylglutathione lyase